jgi:hypothetical protein
VQGLRGVPSRNDRNADEASEEGDVVIDPDLI